MAANPTHASHQPADQDEAKRAILFDLVKSGKLTPEEAVAHAQKLGIISSSPEHERSPSLSKSKRLHNFSVYKWKEQSLGGGREHRTVQRIILQFDFQSQTLSSIQHGMRSTKLEFIEIAGYQDQSGLRLTIQFESQSDYELDANTPEEKKKIIQLLAAILRGRNKATSDTPLLSQIDEEHTGEPASGHVSAAPGDAEEGEDRKFHKVLVSASQEPKPAQPVSTEYVAPLIKEGLLDKRRHGAGWPPWTRKWVRVYERKLVYYRPEDTEEADGISIPLVPGLVTLGKVDTNKLTITLTERNRAFTFRVVAQSRKAQEERDKWYQVLESACKDNKEKDACLSPGPDRISLQVTTKTVEELFQLAKKEIAVLDKCVSSASTGSSQVDMTIMAIASIVAALEDQYNESANSNASATPPPSTKSSAEEPPFTSWSSQPLPEAPSRSTDEAAVDDHQVKPASEVSPSVEQPQAQEGAVGLAGTSVSAESSSTPEGEPQETSAESPLKPTEIVSETEPLAHSAVSTDEKNVSEERFLASADTGETAHDLTVASEGESLSEDLIAPAAEDLHPAVNGDMGKESLQDSVPHEQTASTKEASSEQPEDEGLSAEGSSSVLPSYEDSPEEGLPSVVEEASKTFPASTENGAGPTAEESHPTTSDDSLGHFPLDETTATAHQWNTSGEDPTSKEITHAPESPERPELDNLAQVQPEVSPREESSSPVTDEMGLGGRGDQDKSPEGVAGGGDSQLPSAGDDKAKAASPAEGEPGCTVSDDESPPVAVRETISPPPSSAGDTTILTPPDNHQPLPDEDATPSAVATLVEGGITTGDEELGSGDQLAMDEPPRSPVDKKDLLPSEGKEDEAVGAPEETPMSRGSTPSQEAPTQEEQVKEGVPSVSEGSPQAVSPGPNKEEDPEMDIVTGKGLETSSQLPGSSNSALQVAAQPAGSESVIDEHQEDVSSAKSPPSNVPIAPSPPPCPPAPAPPPLPPVQSKAESHAQQRKMRQFHWKMLQTDLLVSSGWMEWAMRDMSNALDLKRLEELFKAASTEEHKPLTAQKSTSVTLLDHVRGRNIEIFLSRFPLPVVNLRETLSAQLSRVTEGTALQPDHIVSLKRLQPTDEDRKLCKSCTGDQSQLQVADVFLMELCEVPMLSTRLDLLFTIREFPNNLESFEPILDLAWQACNELNNCGKFAEILQYILAIGNHLNAGSRQGGAHGFRLETLPKLITLRGKDNTTLLHFLIQELNRERPDLLDFPQQMESVAKASEISITSILAELEIMQRDLDKVEKLMKEIVEHPEMTTSNTTVFQAEVKVFLAQYRNKLKTLNKRGDEMEALYIRLLMKYGEPVSTQSEDFFGSWMSTFIGQFKRVRRDLFPPERSVPVKPKVPQGIKVMPAPGGHEKSPKLHNLRSTVTYKLQAKEGWLEKQSTGGRWDKRYFELERGQLHYYRSKAKGQSHVNTIHIHGGVPVTVSSDDGRVLIIETEARRWNIRAESPEVAQDWLNALQHHSKGRA